MATVDYAITRSYQRIFGDPVPRPMLLVRIHRGRRHSAPVLAVVDSGADVSTFHPVLAAQAGIDPRSCRTEEAVGVGGRISVAVCDVELEIEGRRSSAGMTSFVSFDSGLTSERSSC